MCTFLAYFHRSKIQLVVNVYFVNYFFFCIMFEYK